MVNWKVNRFGVIKAFGDGVGRLINDYKYDFQRVDQYWEIFIEKFEIIIWGEEFGNFIWNWSNIDVHIIQWSEANVSISNMFCVWLNNFDFDHLHEAILIHQGIYLEYMEETRILDYIYYNYRQIIDYLRNGRYDKDDDFIYDRHGYPFKIGWE